MSNMSYHRIQHLIDQPDENRVKGLAENVYIMTSLGKETAVVKFSVEFCKYLKLQGYEYKELLLLVTDARLKEALAKVSFSDQFFCENCGACDQVGHKNWINTV